MFRTELTIAPQERQLARTARVLTVGSCFADSIGERLRLNKVTTLVNPFGTVFQPLALAQLLRAAAGEDQDWQQHVVEARGRWQSYDFHSTIGAESPVELLQLIQETVRRVGDFVRTADTVVLTLGTAWAYRLRETGELVNNLHKLPAALFEKELLTADEIVNALAEVHAVLRRLNPKIHIVLTVSPVRHIKDTLPLNTVSKSVLRVACHYLSELLPGVSYFPAYELLTDELRDYRFYASDMLHPSEVAEDYIWDKFARAYFDADFGRFRKEWAAVRQSLGHRPLHLGAPEHRTFLDQTAERLERLNSQGVDVRQELRDVQRQLVALPPPKPAYVPEVPLDDEERIDIGDDVVASNDRVATPQVEATNRQPERRNGRQDNRRDGRRADRPGQDRRGGRPLPPAAEPTAADTASPPERQLAEPILDAVIELPATDEAALPGEETTAYPAKKKKRRSRGGAKRTARKNAARLAADHPNGLAEEELLEELAHETTGLPVAVEIAGSKEFNDSSDNVPVIKGDSPATEAMATPLRKRGAGPTPKRSKVITKSGVVKRGERRGLYRAGASTDVGNNPAQAPIISPPIIPEILLERPAVAEAIGPIFADAMAVLPTEAPTKARRSRPKAATPLPATNEEAVARVTEQAPVAAASESVTPKKPTPRAKKAATTKATKPATKPAATKKAAPKKPAAKMPTQRPRRAAGGTPPPAGDSPAT
jgi:hypothetical protein